MQVINYSEDCRGDWEQFVDSNANCTIYHHPGWKEVIETAYGHRCPYLMSRDSERTTGILPLTLIKSRIFGNSLTSLPFVDVSGIVAEDSQSRVALLECAVELCREERLDRLDLRQYQPLEGDFQTDTHKVSLILSLQSDHGAQFKALSSERRNRVRRAQKFELDSELGGSNLLGEFYDIWTQNMRDLGSPAHSLGFFENVLSVLRELTGIIMVTHHGKYIGGAIYLCFKGRLMVPWVSSLRSHFQYYPNNLLYWDALKLAIDKGCTLFDFGRSSVGSGTYKFKKMWGAVEEQLFWQLKSFGGGDSAGPSSESPKFKMATNLWKRLPVGLTRFLGPKVRKYITA